MAYEKQGFHSGEKLKASQLSAMEDGIIEAETLAEEAKTLAKEAALKGTQADYNENNSISASYIKNRPFYEEKFWKEIANGTYTSELREDLMGLYGAQVWYSERIEIPQIVNVIVDGVDYDNLSVTYIDEMEVYCVGNLSYLSAFGLTYENTGEPFIFALGTSGGVLVVDPSNSTTNTFTMEVFVENIVKIDEKFLPELASGVNMEKGAGENATQQLQNQENGVTEGYFNFVGKNPAAIAADPSLNAELKYGAVGDYSASFGGKSTAIGKRAFSEGTTTVAKGAYSHAEGNNSVTLGANSHAEGKCTVTIGENSHSEGFETVAGEFNSHAEGYKTITKGSAAHAEGQETKAYSHQSHAEGLRTVAGDETNPEIGPYAHAEGQDTIAKGEASHAAGIGTVAAGRAQTVVGRYNIEIPDNEDGSGVLFIVGNGNGIPGSENERNIAFAVSSTGEAFINYLGKATNEFSLVNAGQLATMLPTNIKNGNGTNSIVGGLDSIADYSCDFTFGEGLSNTFEHQTVFGRYNDISNWGNNRPLFMIGNGTDADHRSNAFEVRNDGTIAIKYNGKKYSLQKILELLNSFADGAILAD